MSEILTRTENRQLWFCILIAYLRERVFCIWLSAHPHGNHQLFYETVWPPLLEEMLQMTTAAANKALAEKVPINLN